MLMFGLMVIMLIIERRNIVYEGTQRKLEILPEDVFEEAAEEKEAECLVIWNSESPISVNAHKQMCDVLGEMKIGYDEQDFAEDDTLRLAGYENVVVALDNYDLFGEGSLDLFDVVREGTNLLAVCPPSSLPYLNLVAGRMGILEIGYDMYTVRGLRFCSDFMLGGQGRDYAIDDPFDSSNTVTLTDDCIVHLVSADEREAPIIWEYRHGEGTVVVNLLNYFEKAYRGFYAASYSLLSDACVYPVINGSAFYLDDFPSPVPVGEGEYIRRDYNMDIGTFYTNVWCRMSRKWRRSTESSIAEWSSRTIRMRTRPRWKEMTIYSGSVISGTTCWIWGERSGSMAITTCRWFLRILTMGMNLNPIGNGKARTIYAPPSRN